MAEGGRGSGRVQKIHRKEYLQLKDHFEYIEKNGGMHKLLKLREKEFMFLKARD
jgi:hypothetical protein